FIQMRDIRSKRTWFSCEFSLKGITVTGYESHTGIRSVAMGRKRQKSSSDQTFEPVATQSTGICCTPRNTWLTDHLFRHKSKT
ncbi:hypothetical protein, partial [Pseudomonas syringae]|uniref:hypothetical protein n=1 Tax=Pseudomonas syringae TaxID=317 RepID=UPI001F35ABCE